PHSWSKTADRSPAGSSTACRNTACTRFGSLAMAWPPDGLTLQCDVWLDTCRKKMEKSATRLQSLTQPGPGIGPFLPSLVDRDAQRSRHRFVSQTSEMPQLHHLGGHRVLDSEQGQGLVQCQHLVVRFWSWLIGYGYPVERSTMLEPSFAAGLFDQ